MNSKTLAITSALVLLLSLGVRAAETFTHGPSKDPGYFPIAVWLQEPSNAAKYKAAGINLYVALWKGPTEEQLKALTAAGMPVICDQNEVGLKHKDDPIIVGWMHGDEPDNAQAVKDPKTGKDGYGPPVAPAKIVANYERLRAADPTRPVLLNLGQGVANDHWVGRGSDAKLSDYPQYVKGCDVVSFDVYPVASLNPPDNENQLWYVAKGVSRLREWSEGKKGIWNCIECTRISSGRRATPAQVRAEVWMSIIHGSRGIIYFVHEWKPKFNEHALLNDPEMLEAVTKLNAEVRELAPAINSVELPEKERASVQSDAKDVPIGIDTRRVGNVTYVFAAGMRNAKTSGSFKVPHITAGTTIEVINEGRTVKAAADGQFEDAFEPYAVHLYRITAK